MRVSVPVSWGSNNVPFDSGPRPYRILYYNTGTVKVTNTTAALGMATKTRSAKQSPPMVAGWRFASPYSCRIVRCNRTPATQWTVSPGVHTEWYAYPTMSLGLSLLTMSDSSLASAYSTLSTASGTGALAKLNDTHIEAGVTLLEAKKTIGHLAGTASRLFRLLLAMRRGRFRDAADILGLSLSRKKRWNLARDWLEYQYAWRPLVMDVSAAYNIAQQKVEKPLTLKGVRDVKRDKTISLPTFVPNQVSGEIRGVLSSAPVNVTLGVKTTIHARIRSEEAAILKSYGLLNPPAVAWELTPWSFLIDWVFPVGEFLNACTASFGLSFVDGSVSRYLLADVEVDDYGGTFSHDLSSPHPYTLGTRSYEVHESSRTVLSDFPSAGLVPKQTYLSTANVITAAALWSQLR